MKLWIHEIWLLLLAAIFILAQAFFTKPTQEPRLSYVAPPVEIKYIAAGFQKQLSDTFWLRSVQDTEYCENKKTEAECAGKSWFYNIINLVVNLDDEFIEAYYYGGLSLTILINDYTGATAIFDKAVVKFKHEWPLLYLAAYHALFEEKNKAKAAQLYLAAANNGAPSWVRLSAGRLAAEGGSENVAEEILQQMIQLEQDEKWIKELKSKLEQQKKLKQ